MTALHETARRILAHHREAGTPEAERARGVVTDHLTALGYRVSLQRFRFHPSALLGLPILGAGIGASGLLALPLLTLPAVPAPGALAVWSVVLAASVCLAAGVAAGWLTFGEGREDANLIAVRSGGPVRRWIVAHLDTKAQAAVDGGPAGGDLGAGRRDRRWRRPGPWLGCGARFPCGSARPAPAWR